MKRLLALAAIALLATAAGKPAPRRAPAKAAAPIDWTLMVGRNKDGATVIGNPAAKVKLIEFASYTCPHCGHFAAESHDVLKGQMIKRGSVLFMFVHATRDDLDLAAAVVARCSGRRFSATSDAIFAHQDEWAPKGADYQQANLERLSRADPGVRLKAYADASGLSAIGAANGVTPARLTACFADKADRDRVAVMSDAAWAAIRGTPTFILNGQLIEMAAWDTLEPALRTAGAK